jgi:hypothetical protein
MWAWEMLAGRWYELLTAPTLVAQIMTAGALAVMRRRRAHVAAQRDAAALSPFDSLPLVLLSLTLRTANLMMRDLGNVRLVCHEWTQAIDAHLRSVAHRYCVLAEHTVGAFCSYYQEELAHFNMFAESGWMVDAGTPLTLNTLRFRQLQVFRVCSFPNRSNEDWLFSLLSQLATLPVLEDITIGTEETWLTIEPDMDEDKYFAVLRVLLAQLKRVHTFRGNLGLVDHSRIFLVDAVKALPSLRHIDSEAGDEWTSDFWIQRNADVAKSIGSLSRLQLESLTCIENDSFFWEHFSAVEQCNMKRLKVRAHANKDAWQTASECTRLVDEVRRMPKLEELKVSFESLEEVFSCTFNSEGKVDERSPENAIFSRTLRSQLEQLVHQETGSAHSLGGDGDTHEEFMERALRLLAPQIRVSSCWGP